MPTHTRDLIFSSIDFLPEIELLLCSGKVWVLCVWERERCFFIVFVEACVCLKETDQKRKTQKKITEKMNAAGCVPEYFCVAVLFLTKELNVCEKNISKTRGRKTGSYLSQTNLCVGLCVCFCPSGQLGRQFGALWVCHQQCWSWNRPGIWVPGGSWHQQQLTHCACESKSGQNFDLNKCIFDFAWKKP